MSLGLYALDEEGHVWFDVDCYHSMGTIFPKHVAFNINADSDTRRILMLYTGYLMPTTIAGKTLVRSGAHVRVQDIVGELWQQLSRARGLGQLPIESVGYVRFVHCTEEGWWSVSCTWQMLHNGIVIQSDVPVKLQPGKLECIGNSYTAALDDWMKTRGSSIAYRLRSALKAAAAQSNNIEVPSVRQPVRLDLCVRPFADCDTILDR